MSSFDSEMMKAWEKSVAAWWDEVLDSDEFLDAMGSNVAGGARARAGYEQNVDKGMQSLHLPTRKDLVRVARICGLLEDKLLGMEDKLLAMDDRLADMERASLQARIDAAEARLANQEKLATIEAKLDRLLAGS
jgi:hypothetical protein